MPAALAATFGAAAHAEDLNGLLPPEVQSAKVINLVTDARWPPFVFMGSDGKTPEGFEIDILRAIADKLGVEIKSTSVEFAGLIPGVQSGRYDVAMLAIAETPERRKTLSFVDYSYSTMAAFTLSGNATTKGGADDLCGATVGVQSGTTHVDFLSKSLTDHCKSIGKEAPKKLEFATADAVYLSLYSERADYIISSAAIAGDIIPKAPRPVRIVTDALFPKELNGIVYLKDRTKLGEALLAGLKAVHADGTYDKIMKKWNVEALSLDTPAINLGETQGN
ncbi:ABC transporter substrate-binding protein [Kaistia sp. 32K]|nr:ABC transporter substrate-binding protein [Kaistia sp. 32K]